MRMRFAFIIFSVLFLLLIETAFSQGRQGRQERPERQEIQENTVNLAQFPRVSAWINSRAVTDQERDYYGADLSIFPPAVRTWVINRGFPRANMERPHMLDPRLRAWWSDNGHSIHFEASYTTARGFVGAGTRQTWGENARYSGSDVIFERYGEYARFHTMRAEWERTQEVERLLRNDIMFAEIIEFAMHLSEEIEYDWAAFSGYRGARVIRTPGKRYAVCDGYADEVMERAIRLNSVQAVQKWTSPGHAWNVLILTDGRKLFFDLTWFDNEHIDHQTGRIYQTDDYRWINITFDEELFNSAVGYSGVSYHAIGRLQREITK